MKTLLLLICVLIFSHYRADGQSDWLHSKVYKTNLASGYISKDGKVIYRQTNNELLRKATFLEYFNGKIQCTTSYIFREGNKNLTFTFRNEYNANTYAQIVEMPSSPSPSYSSFAITHNQKKEVVDHGLKYGLYRYGNFIELLYVKSLQGNILIQN